MFGNLHRQLDARQGQGPAGGVAGPDPHDRADHPDALLPASRRRQGAGMSDAAEPRGVARGPRGSATRGASRTFLAAVTWAYLAWSILPGGHRDRLLVQRRTIPQRRGRDSRSGGGRRSDPRRRCCSRPGAATARSVQSLRLSFITMIIAVPLGTLFAIGIDRWHGRHRRLANFLMLLLVRRARDHHRRLVVPVLHVPAEVVVHLGTVRAGAGAGRRTRSPIR